MNISKNVPPDMNAHTLINYSQLICISIVKPICTNLSTSTTT